MADGGLIRLRIVVPTRMLVDESVRKVSAEGLDGAFCLLPRHIDFVSALAPGVLSYVTADGAERFAGLDEGILVKRGPVVRIATLAGVTGLDLESLRSALADQLVRRGERELMARHALARLEAAMVRRVVEWERSA